MSLFPAPARGRPALVAVLARMAMLALLVVGCGAGWTRAELGPPTELPPRQQVQVWTADGEHRVLQSVRLDSLTLTGVPYHRPPDCGSCRVTIDRADVDSVRLGSKPRGFLRSGGAGYVISIAVLAVWLRLL